jgi:hypothetical protein
MEPKCGFGGNVGILLDCPEALTGIINAPLRILLFLPSQEISRSSEIGERASVRSCVRVCVHARSGVVLRPFCSLLLVRSDGAQSVTAAWREFLAWN